MPSAATSGKFVTWLQLAACHCRSSARSSGRSARRSSRWAQPLHNAARSIRWRGPCLPLFAIRFTLNFCRSRCLLVVSGGDAAGLFRRLPGLQRQQGQGVPGARAAGARLPCAWALLLLFALLLCPLAAASAPASLQQAAAGNTVGAWTFVSAAAVDCYQMIECLATADVACRLRLSHACKWCSRMAAPPHSRPPMPAAAATATVRKQQAQQRQQQKLPAAAAAAATVGKQVAACNRAQPVWCAWHSGRGRSQCWKRGHHPSASTSRGAAAWLCTSWQ